MSNKYKFNNFFGEETLDTEFKVPSMNFCGTMISDDIAVKMLKSNKFIFNDAILSNIIKSMSYYFLKYFTAFMNSNLQHAELYYGINDFGTIVGFPYMGDFNIDIVKKNIIKIISPENIKSRFIKKDIEKMFDIELIEIDYTHQKDNNLYSKFIKQQQYNYLKISSYQRNINKINNNLSLYATKLLTIITNKRTQKELIDYIYNHLEYKDIKLFYKLQKQIKLGNYPIYPSHEMIQIYKEDNTTVYYWLTRFKDDRIAFIRSLRPMRPTLNNSINPNCLISMIEPMIPNWMNHNENMQLYLIKISFYPNKINDDDKVIYYNYDGEYIYCIRDVDAFGMPCCTPS